MICWHVFCHSAGTNKDLKQTASGYGNRIDPIYKTVKFHAGMDFSANVGTPVYATGNGTVQKAGWEGLYGNCIVINHGFGYVTRYAHLSKIDVKRRAESSAWRNYWQGRKYGKEYRTAFTLRSASERADYESGELLLHGFGCG